MSKQLSSLDRLRIEGAVWGLDQRLYDLPRKSRIAHRHELRANLVAAASDVGATRALRDLGKRGALAEEYRQAAFGSRRRPAWISAGVFVWTATLVLNSVFFDAAKAFGDGILAGNADATGTFHWSGIALLQSKVTYSVADGHHRFVGGAFTPFTWALLAVGFVAFGRVWRALPKRQGHAEAVVNA